MTTARRYHTLERQYWDQAQFRGYLDPRLYKTGAIWTFGRPLASVLKSASCAPPSAVYDGMAMLEVEMTVPTASVGEDGAVRCRVPVSDCRPVPW